MRNMISKRKHVFAWIIMFVMVLGLVPASSAWADGADTDNGQVGGQDNGQNDGSGGQRSIAIIFEGKDMGSGLYEFSAGDYTFTVSFTGGTVENGVWTVTDGEHNTWINLGNQFDRDRYTVKLVAADGFSVEPMINGDNQALVFTSSENTDVNLPDKVSMVFEERTQGDDGSDVQDGEASGRFKAIVNICGPEGSWALSPAVDEPYDIRNEDGSASAPYSKYAFVAGISINGGDRSQRMQHYNSENDITSLKTQTIGFDKDESDDTVTFSFNTAWSDRIESVIINGIPYDIPLNYDDRYSWLTAFGNQDIRFDISGIVLPAPDSEGRYVFDVELKVRPITWDECFVGNFLWSKDEHFSPEGPDPSDIYIGHSSLILESVDFNNGREDVHWQIDAEDDGTDKEYTYEENGVSYDYAHFSMKYPENDCSMGEMVIPEGAEVTMKIVPEYGYQVKYFTGVDFEEGNVKLQGGQCEFTFVVGRGNFHIGAKVEEQEDDLISSSETVVGGGVLLPEGIIDSGSARLDVSDAELSEAKISDFNDVAEREGLEIGAFLELDLKQVFFKGMDDDMEVWENPIELDELKDDDSILVGLQLPEDAEIPDDLTIIHNIGNGEEFERIEPVSIDNNMVIFETKGFSSYALAFSVEDTEDSSTDEDVTEDVSSEEVTSEEGASEEAAKDADIEEASEDKTDAASEAVDNSPKTGDGSETGLMMIILLVSAGIMCVLAQRKKNNVCTGTKKKE